MEARNKLVIIGNGFDLAHGLKTSYNHFIEWYLDKIIIDEKGNYSYEDKVITIRSRAYINYKHNLNVEWFVKEMKNKFFFDVPNISPFLLKLLNKSKESSWVDIETEYYNSLAYIYKNIQKQNYISEVNELNSDFEYIKNQLEEYLRTINCKEINQDINNLFQSDFCRGFFGEDSNKQIHYLNFNYTNTIEKYIHPESNFQLNYIHGKLNDKCNPLIFGYGDEMDEHYKKIEDLSINNFLNNFKSFGYFRTENYSNLLRFINSEPYEIEILGHSCGLSDRVLLNTIFEHDNCQSIKIHYYQKSETENDFITKTQEISRHFNDKPKMRARIVDFTKCSPLVRYKK